MPLGRTRRVGLEYGVLSMEVVGTTAVDVVAVASAGEIFHGAVLQVANDNGRDLPRIVLKKKENTKGDFLTDSFSQTLTLSVRS